MLLVVTGASHTMSGTEYTSTSQTQGRSGTWISTQKVRGTMCWALRCWCGLRKLTARTSNKRCGHEPRLLRNAFGAIPVLLTKLVGSLPITVCKSIAIEWFNVALVPRRCNHVGVYNILEFARCRHPKWTKLLQHITLQDDHENSGCRNRARFMNLILRVLSVRNVGQQRSSDSSTNFYFILHKFSSVV